MSYKLVSEVLAGQPADSSQGERLVLFVLAHHADEHTRECWPGMDLLCSETGMHEDSVRRAITRLERRGIRLRASRPGPGHRTVYRLPTMPRHPDAASPRLTEHPDATAAHSATEHPDVPKATPGRNVVQHPDATSPPEGQEPSEPSIHRARDNGGYQPPLLATVDGSGDTRAHAQAKARQAFAAALDAKRRRPA